MTTLAEWKTRLSESVKSFDVERAARGCRNGCWIYGAGGFGQLTAEALGRGGYTVLGFIDRSARSSPKIGQYACVHPDDLKPSQVEGTTYIHGLMNYAFPSADVARWAANLPFVTLLFPAEVCCLPDVTLENYWLTKPSTLLAATERTGRVHDALADEASRETYRTVISYRISGDPRTHPPVSAHDQYAPDFLPIFGRPIAFVDAGAYTGDSFESLLAHGVDIREWIAFEPDEANFQKLVETAKRHRKSLQHCTLYPCGLSEKHGKIAFSESRGQSSQVLDSGTPAAVPERAEMTRIQVLRLDDILWTHTDAYIKLDIEGAELSALNGMMEMLIEKRSTVAVSIYHRPADLWEIPEFFMRHFEGRRLYVRQHGHHGFDTVLYVTP